MLQIDSLNRVLRCILTKANKSMKNSQKLCTSVLCCKIRVKVHIGAARTHTKTRIPGLRISTFDLCFTIQISKRAESHNMSTKDVNVRFVS